MKHTLLFSFTLIFLSSVSSFAQQQKDDRVKYSQWEQEQRTEFYPSGIPAVKGYKQFERSNLVWENHLDKEGYMINYGAANMDAYMQLKSMTETTGSEWDFVGPHGPDYDSDFTTGGTGRVNCIQVFDEDTWFVGASGGGLWKTDNSGIYFPGVWDNPWENLTSGFPLLSISGIAVNPANENEIYILTGDPFNSGLPSIGIYKTTDQGATWTVTSLAFERSELAYGYKLLFNPQNFQEMYACTTWGLFHTTDGWETNTEIIDNRIFDVEYHPTDTSIVYASGDDQIYRKCCGDDEFSGANNGVTETNTRRVDLEVTPAAPDWVYSVFIHDDRSLNGIYLSTDQATNWNLQTNGSYNLSASTDPEDPEDKGQGEYCMAFYAADDVATMLYYGCVNLWFSAGLGLAGTWSQFSDWTSDGDVHADWHALEKNPYNGTLIAGTDGGVYVSDDGGANWSNRNYGLHITEFYHLGVDNHYLYTLEAAGGAQDNGTIMSLAVDGTSVDENIQGGDGFEVYLNSLGESGTERYTESQYGKLYFDGSYDGFPYSGTIYPDEVEEGIENKTNRFNTPYKVNPYNWDNVIIGYDDLYFSSNKGLDWAKAWDNEIMFDGYNPTEITDIDFLTAQEAAFVVDVLDVGIQVWATTQLTNALIIPEVAWTRLSAIELALGVNDNISDVSMYYHTEDVNYMRLMVSIGGYDSLNKILYIPDLINNEDSVVNLTYDFPNIPALCIEQHETGIYVGTDIGVFYLPNEAVYWQYHSTGLPVVPVTEIQFKETILEGEMMYISTYGRGLWRNFLAEAQPKKWYVDVDATGTNDGTSWEHAFTNLNTALTEAQPQDTLWIAEGAYYPSNSRSAFFNIDGEKLYGGFNGTETELEERNPALHISRMSGDIGTVAVATDNVYRLLAVNPTTNHCQFDGITFSGGYANGSTGDLKKGGCFKLTTYNPLLEDPYIRKRPHFSNCVFENFYAQDYGGVFFFEDYTTQFYEGSSAVPDPPVIFDDCLFRNNTSGSGGVIYNDNSNLFAGNISASTGDANFIVNGCTFENNTAVQGAAIYLNSREIVIEKTFSNITFTGNIASDDGGAILSTSSIGGLAILTIENCTFTNNEATDRGGAIHNYAGTGNSYYNPPGQAITNYIDCAFTGNSAAQGGAVSYNMGAGDAEEGLAQALFTNCSFTDCYATNYGGAVFADATNSGSSGIFSFDGCTFVNNDAGIQGGAIKGDGAGSGHCEIYLNQCSFTGSNTGSNGGAIYGEAFVSGYFSIIADSCSFDNCAADHGGAIFLRSTTTGTGTIVGAFTNTSFTSNHADGASNASGGGAVHHSGRNGQTCTYDNCTFTGNHSNQRAGAVYINLNDIAFTNCDFTGNHCPDSGGVSYIYHWSGGSEQHTTSFENCFFQDNLCNGNGGIVSGALSSAYALNIPVTNCEFINNQGQNGGCFNISGGTTAHIDFIGTTFTSNQTEISGSGGVLAYNARGSVDVLDCTFDGNTAGINGGTLDILSYGNDVTVNIQHSDFLNGDADYGGAIHTWNDNSTNMPIVISNCTFDNNEADLGVGGVYLQVQDYCEIEIDSCIFTNNHSLSSASSTGALYLKSFLASDTSYMHVSNTLFDNNSAVGPAGALHYVSDGSLRSLVENCTFTNNTTNSHGGAIRVYAYANDYADVDILNCLFDNNTATLRGGAIHFESSVGGSEIWGLVNQCVLVNNQAADGGAIQSYISTAGSTNRLDVYNSTIANNHATTKCGGVYAQRTNGTMSGSTVNNIIWGNTDNDTELDQKQAYVNGTGVITMSNTDIQNGVPPTFINSSDNISTDPQFLDVLNTDGSDLIFATPDDGFAIQSTSPVIDLASGVYSNSTDIANTPRPQINGYDMGAYEALAAEEETCAGDLNDDGVVNTTDLLLFMSEFGCTTSCGIADMNNDGVVNTTDLLLFMSAFGGVCG
ncbi:MAG: choice-of-anchor Q domain-containing protein [Flavobacteriales bacterium]|nr:choice-of-anchor Q domain-containing protein [Flavobacteriales bacterium]